MRLRSPAGASIVPCVVVTATGSAVFTKVERCALGGVFVSAAGCEFGADTRGDLFAKLSSTGTGLPLSVPAVTAFPAKLGVGLTIGVGSPLGAGSMDEVGRVAPSGIRRVVSCADCCGPGSAVVTKTDVAVSGREMERVAMAGWVVTTGAGAVACATAVD